MGAAVSGSARHSSSLLFSVPSDDCPSCAGNPRHTSGAGHLMSAANGGRAHLCGQLAVKTSWMMCASSQIRCCTSLGASSSATALLSVARFGSGCAGVGARVGRRQPASERRRRWRGAHRELEALQACRVQLLQWRRRFGRWLRQPMSGTRGGAADDKAR